MTRGAYIGKVLSLGLVGFVALAEARLPAIAQDDQAPPKAGTGLQVMVIDQERLFNESRYGRAILEEIRQRSQELAEENRRLERSLEAEEKALAEKRKQLEPGEFRVLAEEFNAKVERIRAEQAAKEQEIFRALTERRQQFFNRVGKIVIQLTEELGAAVVLDKRVTIYTAPKADVTDRLIARVDRELAPEAGENGTVDSPGSQGSPARIQGGSGAFPLGTPVPEGSTGPAEN